ncbi:ATP-dependent 23S rRNA helicase DbpA [hydrothermal vent metagenome]|uniref:ATP-dependent 23S rRNA helicase DbpA n=1 Tax=hydrothermal vent metagenome TaxID=652676 RepID=A0A1W1CBV1_9ZZZZ
MQKFNTIKSLSSELIKTLEQLEYTTMTAIQEATIPILLEGKDIIAQAKTGSGKTASFGIPIIEKIDTKNRNPQTLILCPTRELADQVAKELRSIARYKNNLKILTLCGGTPMRPQIASLEQGGHILVGTAGRVQDHLSRETIYLKDINTLVLDEADRMVDMGFYDEIKKIISNIPKKRHTMLFSATYPPNIQKLAKEILREPVTIKADITHEVLAIEEVAYEIEKSSKPESLIKLFKSYKPKTALVFCNTKIETIELTDFLREKNFSAMDLQGDLDQREREEALLMFANGSISILVATDVASRGLDVKNIELVINYDIPHGDEIYTHRIGRTARAGAKGKAITLYTNREKDKLFDVAKNIEKRDINKISIDRKFIMESDYSTICIDGGKKNKVRAGDILGALSKNIGISGEQIGKIDIFDFKSFVAIDKRSIRKAFDGLKKGKIKGKKFRVWWL